MPALWAGTTGGAALPLPPPLECEELLPFLQLALVGWTGWLGLCVCHRKITSLNPVLGIVTSLVGSSAWRRTLPSPEKCPEGSQING